MLHAHIARFDVMATATLFWELNKPLYIERVAAVWLSFCYNSLKTVTAPIVTLVLNLKHLVETIVQI